ncbi:Neutrophil cytosol factor 2 [Neolecta irregularis DAH-3]|uniref:Neutrophil cytosol factor 2 n=1 Tax=Neolecta irregularis (strain DAH-3) TaxID=1198029 RepID=A0A1U7LR71_NEOID|nr:Neutrophil cytosol factor 2 [Neolecta irregularis DAH-3]|eukprot:OLL25170.1 Neutrophil cytosol factor 2 [Neolecta irregularis DAH-3]
MSIKVRIPLFTMVQLKTCQQELETWVSALAFFDGQEYDKSLAEFEMIGDQAKYLFNIGIIHATVGRHIQAVQSFQEAVKLDRYLAIAYFQAGVSNFLLEEFELALGNFNDALLYLRGNVLIDYDQIGLTFRLFSCEVLFNRGLCQISQGQTKEGMADLRFAWKEKQTLEHDVIDEAIAAEALVCLESHKWNLHLQGFTVFSIPVGVLFRPNQNKVRNAKTKDYLGKARLVAATDRKDIFTGFTGSELQKARVSFREEQNISMEQRPKLAKTSVAQSVSSSSFNSFESTSFNQLNHILRSNTINLPPTPPNEGETSHRELLMRNYSTSDRSDIRDQDKSRRRGRDRSRPAYPSDNRTINRSLSRRGFLSSRGSSQERSQVSAYSAYTSSSRRIQQSRNNSEEDEPFDAQSLYDAYCYYDNDHQKRTHRQKAPRRTDDQSDYEEDYNEPDFEMIRKIECQKVKVRIHFANEIRALVVPIDIEFDKFRRRIIDKLEIKCRIKVKARDEDGELIVLGDNEDLEMIMFAAKEEARRKRVELGRIEVWCLEESTYL